MYKNEDTVSTDQNEKKVDFKKVWKILTSGSIFRSPKDSNILKEFANLIASKSSFAHKAHSEFKKIQTN